MGVCMLKVKMCMLVLVAATSSAFATKADAFVSPSKLCNASNLGEFTYTYNGRNKYEWYCNGSQWVFNLQYFCNQYGNNCIPY